MLPVCVCVLMVKVINTHGKKMKITSQLYMSKQWLVYPSSTFLFISKSVCVSVCPSVNETIHLVLLYTLIFFT